MEKTDHMMEEKNKNNKDSQKGQVTPKKYFNKTQKLFVRNQVVIYSLKYV